MTFRIESLDYKDFPQFSHFDKSFIAKDEKLTHFVGAWADLTALNKKAESRSFSQKSRKRLTDVLKSQYSTLGHYDQFQSVINSLEDENCFTVITAHQPVLFGGPLYIPYKIASAINLARQITENGDKTVLPVFVIGGEDHDFEEVNHLNIFGKKITWEHHNGGPVGRMDSKGLSDVIDQVTSFFSNGRTDVDIEDLLRSSFTPERSYAQAYQDFIIKLFGQYDLIVLNMDSKELKAAFKDVMIREVKEQLSYQEVNQVQDAKAEAGFDAQAFVREVNLFYMTDNLRSVITKEGDRFHIRDNDEYLTEQELIDEIESSPWNFSPNVVLRPLYQEYSLPNIAYIGGGGELSYWSERKSQFEAFDISFPLLVRRCSVMHIDDFIEKKMDAAGMDLNQLMKSKHQTIHELVSQDTTLDDELKALSNDVLKAFEVLVVKLEEQSDSLGKYARSEERKLEKTMESFQTKSFREIKKDYDVKVNQIEKVYDHLFPSNGLQERYANFLPYYAKFGRPYLDYLVQQLNPLTDKWIVLYDN